MVKKRFRFLFIFALALFLEQGTYSLVGESAENRQDPILVLDRYLRASYARDYKEAYQYISAQDGRLKDERNYVRERGAFTGFTLEIAKILASYIELTPVETRLTTDRATVRLNVKLPDANKLASILLDWDTDRLEGLSKSQRKGIIDSLEKLRQDRKFAMVDGEESFELVREAGAWKIFLNWAAGLKLTFQTTMPASAPIEAKLLQSEITTRAGELFNVSLMIRNTAEQAITVRIGHLVDPHEVRDFLDLVECGFLLPVRLLPGKEEEFVSTYLLRGSLPEKIRQLNVTYALTLQN